MNIGITSSTNYNKYALALTYFLAEESHKPKCIILIKEPIYKSIIRNIKLLGFKHTIVKILRLRGYKVASSNRDYLQKAASSRNIQVSHLSLPKVCKSMGIELVTIDDINSPKAVEMIKSKHLDILINATGCIYKSKVIDSIKTGILNAHMGFLPDFRGMNVLEWSLYYNQQIGVTLHFIERGIDTGDILLFKEIAIEPGDRITDLREKSVVTNVELIIEAITKLEKSNLIRIKQQPSDGKQFFTMHPRLKKILERKLNCTN